VPRLYQAYGHDRFKAWLTYDRPQLENQAFFWRVYAPMMRSILAETHARSQEPGTGPR
jgi:hypothetical protein